VTGVELGVKHYYSMAKRGGWKLDKKLFVSGLYSSHMIYIYIYIYIYM
jgi:hypothetical protein